MKKFHANLRKVAFGLLLTFTTYSYSQTIYQGAEAENLIKGSEMVRTSKHSDLPSYVSFRPGEEKDLGTFPLWLEANFKINKNMHFYQIRAEKDQIGMTHTRFQQMLNGNPVEHGILVVHSKNGKVSSFNGLIYKEITPRTPSLSAATALQKAKDHIGAAVYKWELPGEEEHLKWEQDDVNATYFPAGELVYISPRGSFNSKDIKLCFMFNIYAQEPDSRNEIFVDAQTGAIVAENEIIHHVDAVGSATTGYSGTKAITTDDQGGGSFRLRETGRGNGIRTFNMQEGTSFGAAVDFTDSDNNWNNANAQLDQYATDAHWGAEMTYDYLQNDHGRNSIDGNGFQLNSYVHYDESWSNASWDGQRMRYGDGNNQPFTALDIAGHEIGHGLTTNTADLVYQDEPGALNESFSDIIGTLVENHGRPGNWNWLIGEDLGSALRNMQNPNSVGDPDTRFGNNWAPLGGTDQGGVHTNSSVQNYWFYLTAMGGTGTNDNSDSYSVTGIGLSNAADVAYRNLTVYLTTSSDFDDARFYGIQAAIDLYGGCSAQVEAVTNAWYAVGVGQEYVPYASADFDAPVIESCQAPLTVSFNNLSVNGTTFTWDFGDGSPTSSDYEPSHTYTNFGQYTVTLNIDGGVCGADQRIMPNYVNVDASAPCVVVFIPNTVMPTQNQCSGTVYDSGGPGGSYGPNEATTMTIAPTGASQVTLNFSFFDIEPGSGTSCDYDKLFVFDGPNTNSPLIGTYCNNNVPATINSTTGSITVKFISDPGLELGGFEMTWACVIPTSSPTAEFIADNVTSCTGKVQFTDNSTDSPTTWLWDFGDGNTSNIPNPTHTYSANGSYTVSLAVTNSLGNDDEVKTNFITIATPTPPTTTDATVCNGSSVSLVASGAGILDWFDATTGGNLVYSGNTYPTPPLTASTIYYVEDNLANAPVNVGPVSNTFATGGNFNGDQTLIFSAFVPVTLRSVKVYSALSGYRQIQLKTSGGQLLLNKNVYIPTGESRVYLNMDVPVGTGLTLGCLAGSSPQLFRNDAGASFPYTQTGLISITSSSAGTDYYYFFYDWEVQEAGCKSYRSPIVATVDPCLNINENIELEFKIYPNPSNSFVTIEVGAKAFDYELTNTYGQLISSKRNLYEITNIDLSRLSTGIYFVKIKVGAEYKIEKLIKN